MKLRKRLILLEDFKTKTTDASNIANVTEVPVNKTKNTSTRNDVIADVDAILTNLETLSAQITESALITEAGELEAVFKSIKSTWAIAKSSSMLKTFGELEQANNADLMAVKTSALAMKLAAELEKAGEDQSAEGKVRAAKMKAKMSVAQEKMESELEVEKERAKNELDAFNVELGTAEEDISKDTALGRAYQATKMKVSSDIRLLGKTELAKQKMAAGNEKAAKALAEDIKRFQGESEELAKKIADGNAEGGEDMKELAGIKAYVGEIDAIQKANQALGTIRAEAEKAKESVVAESNIFGFDIETILESTLTDLYSASKSRANVAGLAKAKELAAKFKQAGTAKIEAQRALADKIKGKEVTKTVIIIAGGDGDAAKEGENGYTLTTFIKSLGGGNDMISAEEYATVKDAIEIEGEVDQAITDAEEGNSNSGGTTEKTSQQLADEFIADNEGFEVITDKGATVPVANADGEDEQKPKYEGEQDFTGKKEDGSDDDVVTVGKEIDYNNTDDQTKSAEDVATEALSDAKADYTKITADQESETIDVPPAEEGGEPTTKPKWTDIKKFKGKDAEGADTEEEVIYAKQNDNQSAATVAGIKLDEGMSVAEKFAILMNR